MGDGARMAVSAHGLGEYPTAYDVPVLPERRTRIATRFYGRWAAVGFLTAAALGSSVIALGALKSVEPAIAVRDGEAVYGAVAAPEVIPGDVAYMRQQVERYVSLRFSIRSDRQEMARIWGQNGELAVMDPGFPNLLKVIGEDLVADVNAGITQAAILVETAEVVPGRVYVVDFDLVRRDKSGKIIASEAWRAHVEVGFDPARGGVMNNPLGFKVVAFSQEPRR